MSAQRDNLLKQCDCEPVRWPKCPHSWHVVAKRQWVSLDVHCKARQLPLVRTRGDAEKLRDDIVPQLEAGTYQKKPTATVAVAGETFDETWPRYVEVECGHYENVASITSFYTRLASVDLPGLGRAGAVGLGAFTEGALELLFAKATRGKSAATKVGYRSALRKLFAWATKKKTLAVNPITDDTTMPCGKMNMRMRRVKPDEEARLVTAAGGLSEQLWWFPALLIVAIDCALRRGELLALQWTDILWDAGLDGRLRIAAEQQGARKNRKARHVPLTPRVVRLLRQLQASNPTGKPWSETAYVFGDATGAKASIKQIRRVWERCVVLSQGATVGWSQAGEFDAATRATYLDAKLHLHDLRHEGALRWLALGYTLPTIAKLLGHSNLDTLKVYLGIDEENALDEAERINAECQESTFALERVRAAVKRQYSERQEAKLVLRKGAQVAVGE